MQEVVLGSHLALMNVYMALEADKDPVPKKNAKAPSDSDVNEYNRGLQRTRERVRDMAASPLAYIRATGYHDVFGVEPEQLKSAEEIRREEIERNRAVPTETKNYFLNDSVLSRAAEHGGSFTPAG